MVIYILNQENAPHLCKCHVCHPTGQCSDHRKGQLLLQQKILQTGKGSLACTELTGRFSLSKESLRRTFIMVLTVLHFIPYWQRGDTNYLTGFRAKYQQTLLLQRVIFLDFFFSFFKNFKKPLQTSLEQHHTHKQCLIPHSECPTPGLGSSCSTSPKAEAVAMCWFGFLAANTVGLELAGAHQTFIKNKAAVYINSDYTNLKE